MSRFVHPDPQEPAGGFAFLELPGGALPDAPVGVAVQEVFGDRWLAPTGDVAGRVGIGNPNWQTTRHDFGPYTVHRHDGADWVRIGPEIVNKLAEYTPLRIAVGALLLDVTWPDDVPPRAGAAVLGGIRAVGRGRPPEPEPVPVPVPVPPAGDEAEPEPPEPAGDLPEQPVGATQSGRRPTWLAPLLLVLALLAALLAAWWLIPDDMPQQPAHADVPKSDRCTLTALDAVSGGFAVVEQAIRDCGADITPDTALRLVEDAAARGDPGALLLFGVLYDATELDPQIENLIGLSFADDPARAAEYYARAVTAGSLPAKHRLSAICIRLAGADATLDKGAHDDFCR